LQRWKPKANLLHAWHSHQNEWWLPDENDAGLDALYDHTAAPVEAIVDEIVRTIDPRPVARCPGAKSSGACHPVPHAAARQARQ
jgi:hypothetical protein